MKKLPVLFIFIINFCFSQNGNIDTPIEKLLGHNNTIPASIDENYFSSSGNLITDVSAFSGRISETNKEYDFFSKPFISIIDDSIHANDTTSKKQEIDKVKFSILTGSLLGVGVWFHFKQQNAWWKGIRGPFNIRDDWDYACQLDKAGHFFGGMITARTVTECYYWTGVDRNTSLWIGAACGAAWQTYVEIEDGFSRDWGFSPTDFASDILGAFYPVAQEFWVPLRSINLKFSYLPSSDLKTGTWKRGKFVKKDTFIDDYQGQMFWLTVNINDFLPKDYKKYWPAWLQLAIGYGLSKWDGDEEAMGRRVTDKELWLSFDYDIEKLPGDSEFLRLLKKLFNQFHLPAPAVRITPGATWYGLFFAHGL